MRRRDFITLVSGAAVMRSLVARAQQREHLRLIGLLTSSVNAREQPLVDGFRTTLQQLGWSDGRNVRFDVRFGKGDAEYTRRQAGELVAQAPDIIFAIGSPSVAALLEKTRSVPIVFMAVVDPVSAGYAASLARPGGNATGFMLFEYGIAGKWTELLKQIAPSVTRVAVLRDPAIPAGIGQFAIIQSVAPSLGMEVIPLGVADAAEIERSVATFAGSPDAGLIVTASALSLAHSDLVVALAARYKLPAVYFDRSAVVAGGLVSYGSNLLDQSRRAAGYVDRILKGAKPADLPIQVPTKFELLINTRTAKSLGLTVPQMLLATADEVIE